MAKSENCDDPQGKIADRSKAIKYMTQEAGRSGKGGSRHEVAATALKKFGSEKHTLQTIDLTEKVILGGGTPSNGNYMAYEDPVVQERFNRTSVSQAVDTAFSGDSQRNGLHNAVSQSKKSR